MSPSPEVDLGKLRIERPEENAGRRPRRRRGRGWLGLVILLGLVAATLWWSWPKIEPIVMGLRAPEVRTGSVVRLRPGAALELTTAAGYVVARTRAALAAEVAGRLVEMAVDVGTAVQKGDLIARIDPENWLHLRDQQQAVVDQAEAEAIAAGVRVDIARRAVTRAEREIEEMAASGRENQAALAEAQRVLDLERRLSESGSGTPDALKKAENEVARLTAVKERREASLGMLQAQKASAEAEIRGAEARVEVQKSVGAEARARLAAAAVSLKNTEIRAPFAGVILRKEAEVGEMVVPALAGGSTSRGAVVTMADFATLEMEVDVFERDISMIRDGGPAEIIINAYADVRFPARVRQVVPTAERSKGTVQVKVAFETPDPRILPEMGGKVVFLKERPTLDLAPEVVAPSNAFITRDGKRGVFLKDGDRVRFRDVTLGAEREGRVVVLSGLLGGEQVVLDPAPGLEDGTVVRVSGAN